MTTDLAEEGQKIARSYSRALDDIRRNTELSDESKRRKMAEVYLAAKRKSSDLRTGAREEREKEVERLQEQLVDPRKSPSVSPGADSVAVAASYRDALARAGATSTEAELIATLERAMRVGDDLQARACLTIALERTDLRAINRYAETHPGTEPKLQRLLDLTTGRESSFGAVMQTAVFPPNELDGMADYQLEQLIKSGG